MNTKSMVSLLALLALGQGLPLAAQAPPARISLAANEADLKDILRAATRGTELNVIFDPGLETQVQGLDLKDMSLQELLDEVLPRQGLIALRRGRNLFIRKASGGLRFYQVDHLAMARTGTKTFQVNASGQMLQGGGGMAGTSASAYASSVQVGQTGDPWADLESGLKLLVFGRVLEQPAPGASRQEGSRSYAADGKTLLIQPHSGLVVVSADPGTHGQVEAFLKEVQQRTQRQVLLEARIVEVSLGDDSHLGVDWNGLLGGGGRASGGSSFNTGAPTNAQVGAAQGLLQIVATSGRVEATLTALARDKRLKVLSAPRLATLNNQKAILRVVREEAYALPSSQITPGTAAGGAIATGQITPMIVPVGIILDIQPQIGNDGFITLAVNPSISEVVEEKAFQVPGQGNGWASNRIPATLPVVDRRDLDAVVRIKSGETMVLAGIIKTREGADHRGVPWIRKLPLLGNLFSKKEKSRVRTELAIFITPTLMEEPGQMASERERAEMRLTQAGADLSVAPPKAGTDLAVP